MSYCKEIKKSTPIKYIADSEMNMLCPFCNYKSKKMGTMSMHVAAKHASDANREVNPHKCTYPGCGESFPIKTRLQHHVKNFHDVVFIKCPFPDCEYGNAKNNCSLYTHYVRYHMDYTSMCTNNTECNKCGTVLKTGILYHMATCYETSPFCKKSQESQESQESQDSQDSQDLIIIKGGSSELIPIVKIKPILNDADKRDEAFSPGKLIGLQRTPISAKNNYAHKMLWKVTWNNKRYDYARVMADWKNGNHCGYVNQTQGKAKMNKLIPHVGDMVYVSCNKKKIMKCVVATEFTETPEEIVDNYCIGKSQPQISSNYLRIQIVEVYDEAVAETFMGNQRTWTTLE